MNDSKPGLVNLIAMKSLSVKLRDGSLSINLVYAASKVHSFRVLRMNDRRHFHIEHNKAPFLVIQEHLNEFPLTWIKQVIEPKLYYRMVLAI